MFCGYFLFKEKSIKKKIKFNNLNFNLSFTTGEVNYNVISCVKSFQLIGFINEQKRIVIKNPIEIDFRLDFLSYEDLMIYLKSKDYFYKLSIIIFDNSGHEVYLHRDFFGISPLFYIHVPGEIIAFSSNLTSLLNLPLLKSFLEVNHKKISQYLTWLGDGHMYSSSTFFKNFKNILPGQKLAFINGNMQASSYIQVDSNRWDKITSIEEFGKEFINLFKKSIKRDMKGEVLLSAQLSGGLDSSSICCVIRDSEPEIPIHTLYAFTDTISTDEQEYANIVAKRIKSSHDVIEPMNNSFDIANLHISLYGQPEHMYNGSALNRNIMQCAVSHGSTVIFNGHPGDAIVGYGRDYIVQLFNEGNWAVLKKTISVTAQLMTHLNSKDENPNFKIIYSLLAQKKNEFGRVKMVKLILKAARFFDIPISYFYKNAFRKLKDRFRIPSSILKNNMTSFLKLASHDINITKPDTLASFQDVSTYNDIFSTQSILINEQFFILDKYYGIEHKFPFYDKALLELCMSVPPKLKYDNGKQRGHFREAMKEILPEEIRNRTSKANFGDYGRKVTIKLYFDSLDLLNTENDIWQYVDRGKFKKSVSLLLDDKEALHVYNRVMHFVSKTIYLAIWLNKVKNKSFIALN